MIVPGAGTPAKRGKATVFEESIVGALGSSDNHMLPYIFEKSAYTESYRRRSIDPVFAITDLY